MAEIPERYKIQHECLVGGGFTTPSPDYTARVIEELGTAEACIRKLEQERDQRDPFFVRRNALLREKSKSLEENLQECQARLEEVARAKGQMENEFQMQMRAVIHNGDLLAKELGDMREKVREFDKKLDAVTQQRDRWKEMWIRTIMHAAIRNDEVQG